MLTYAGLVAQDLRLEEARRLIEAAVTSLDEPASPSGKWDCDTKDGGR